jgi:hypothetical protein
MNKSYPGKIIERQERTYSLSEMARMIPGEQTYVTVWMWCTKGRLRDRNDSNSGRVKMEHVNLSNGRRSSMEAYWRFVEELNR